MSPRELPRHTLVCHARAQAFTPGTQVILGRLGYAIWPVEEYDARDADAREVDPPALRIVDERRLGEVEDEPGERPVRIVLLTGRHGASGADPRVVAAVKKPAGPHDLYRVLQQLLEEFPRATPRVPTHLRARCARSGRSWDGSILSISENGCLLRSSEALPLGSAVELAFDLPAAGPIAIVAEPSYQLLPDIGLVFSGLPPGTRRALRDFVTSTLG